MTDSKEQLPTKVGGDEDVVVLKRAPLISLPQWFVIIGLVIAWSVAYIVVVVPLQQLALGLTIVFVCVSLVSASMGALCGVRSGRPLLSGIVGTLVGGMLAALACWVYWGWGTTVLRDNFRPRFDDLVYPFAGSYLLVVGCAATFIPRFIRKRLDRSAENGNVYRMASWEGAKALAVVGAIAAVPLAGVFFGRRDVPRAPLEHLVAIGSMLLIFGGSMAAGFVVGGMAGTVAATTLPTIEPRETWWRRNHRRLMNGILLVATCLSGAVIGRFGMHLWAVVQLRDAIIYFDYAGNDSTFSYSKTFVDTISTPSEDTEPLTAFRWLLFGKTVRLDFYGATDELLLSISNKSAVVSLTMGGDRVTGNGLKCLAGMTNLDSLSILNDQIDRESLHGLPPFPKLRFVNFLTTPVDDHVIQKLVEYSPLIEELRLDGTEITDASAAELAKLANLRWLSISDTEITDAGVIALAKSPQLVRLDVQGTKVTQRGIDLLRRQCPGIRRIDWDGEKPEPIELPPNWQKMIE